MTVPFSMLACRRHWYQVSPDIRRAVWRTWANGAGARSDAHRDAIMEAIAEMTP